MVSPHTTRVSVRNRGILIDVHRPFAARPAVCAAYIGMNRHEGSITGKQCGTTRGPLYGLKAKRYDLASRGDRSGDLASGAFS